jgi:drug/metabolite transporter (DMT)-like permease
MMQLVISAPILLLLAPLFGPLLREVAPVHLAGLAYQIIAVASFGFLAWFWLLTIYPAASVASFSFLSPVFAVLLGWLILSEEVGLSIWAALLLVAAGIYLINRKPRGH